MSKLDAYLYLVAAITAGAWDWLRTIALDPITIAVAGTFLVVLWTIIGVTVLIDRRRPREVRAHVDYRYALTFEGFQPGPYYGVNDPIPNAGNLSFQVMVRNFSQHPIRYEIEEVDIRLGTRAVPRILPGTIYGFMARGGGRTSTIKGFSKDEMAEFYKNNTAENPAKGTVNITLTYGPPDGPPERRMRVAAEIFLIMINDGESIGWQSGITSERDEPLTT